MEKRTTWYFTFGSAHYPGQNLPFEEQVIYTDYWINIIQAFNKLSVLFLSTKSFWFLVAYLTFNSFYYMKVNKLTAKLNVFRNESIFGAIVFAFCFLLEANLL